MNAKTKLLQIANVTAVVSTIVVNALATTLPINNMDTGELSDLYPNLFVPSGLTFSIWGLIYLLLIAFAVYQGLKKSEEVVSRIGILFIVSSAANIGWIFAWHYKLVGLSFLVMLVLLGSLIALYLRLSIGASKPAGGVRWFVHLPFSVYLGWITVATIANATALLVDLGWNGFGLSEPVWTVVVIAAALGITLAVLFTRGDVAYALVPVWALLGIVIKRAFEDPNPVVSVVVAAAAAGILILIGIPAALVMRRRS